MSSIPELLAANERYAAEFTAGALPSPPRRRVAILTCMDARLMPGEFLGLKAGDAHVIRNAGGRASQDALRSLIVSYKVLGSREFMVIQHTDCGQMSYRDDQLQQQLGRDTGADASGVEFLTFDDLEETVRRDVQAIRDSPLIPDEIRVSGYVYDVRSGRLRGVS